MTDPEPIPLWRPLESRAALFAGMGGLLLVVAAMAWTDARELRGRAAVWNSLSDSAEPLPQATPSTES